MMTIIVSAGDAALDCQQSPCKRQALVQQFTDCLPNVFTTSLANTENQRRTLSRAHSRTLWEQTLMSSCASTQLRVQYQAACSKLVLRYKAVETPHCALTLKGRLGTLHGQKQDASMARRKPAHDLTSC